MSCAKAGAKEVTAVDISAAAVEQVRRNAAANSLQILAVEANVFDYLHEREKAGSTYDLIVLDTPPTAHALDFILRRLRHHVSYS